jgi:hypothetical protein
MEAILPLLIPVVFVLGLVLERLFPARQLPKVKGWWLRGVVFFFIAGGINAMLPLVVVTALDGRGDGHARLLGAPVDA